MDFEELKRHIEEYDQNHLLMCATKGTLEFKQYKVREKRLRRRGVEIRKELGIYAYDPCDGKTCADTCIITLEKNECKLLNTLLEGGDNENQKP